MASVMNFREVTAPADLLKVMVVRGIVFIEEQQVRWDDEFDRFEDCAVHFLGEIDGEPVATGRWRRLEDGRTKIERIAVRSRWRGHGYGREVVRYVLAHARAAGAKQLMMHAQTHLEPFYREFGFRREGEVFDECGISHVAMVWEGDEL